MALDELKRKLRKLKKLEAKIRFINLSDTRRRKYIWDEYFSTKDEDDDSVRYNMNKLIGLNHEELKEIFDEYFYHVYFQYYKENGISLKGLYDTGLLSNLGLPPDATFKSIKGKFRELAKKHHPDHGGDSSKFIELVDTYKKLIDDD